MTIKEIEGLSGMTRANIRFYEQEGLLKPQRGGNDYRYYSEEDLASLLKIKLLRQLQVPLDDIRRLQSGELKLGNALGEKLKKLELDIKNAQRSAEICRDIRASNTEYADLDASKYLSRISAEERDGTGYFSIQADELPKANHPWRRFFARHLDYMLYSVLWSALSMLALRWMTGSTPLLQLLDVYITFGIMLFIEPLLLSTIGTTPGKWIFGLQIRDFDGKKLSYSAALWRTWGVFHHGYGYAIPFYSLYRNYKSYKVCAENGVLAWDEETAYTITDLKIRRAIAFIAANALVFGLLAFVLLQAEMPIHRGNLTAAEFAQNFNDLMDYNGIKMGKHLNADGTWRNDPEDGISVDLFELPPPDFEITESDGFVTKISFDVTTEKYTMITDSFTPIMILAVRSFVCAQKDSSFLSQASAFPRGQTALSGFAFTQAGVAVRCDTEYKGYYYFSSNLLSPDQSEKPYFHISFSMEKTA